MIAFDGVSGAIEWRTRSASTTAAFGTTPACPTVGAKACSRTAVGDVDGDGQLDVVFAGFDWNVWAVDHTGAPLMASRSSPTTPSGPHRRSSTSMPMVTSKSSSAATRPLAAVDHLGGVLWALDVEPTGVTELWRGFANEVFHSSGAIGDINDDGRMEIVIGTGHNWRIECAAGNHLCGPGDSSDTNRLFAFHLHDGSTVPGFPVTAEEPDRFPCAWRRR